MKYFKYLFVVVITFSIFLTSASADVTIGAGPGGGSYAGGAWTTFHNNPYGSQDAVQSYGYKIRLVYYDGSDASGTKGEDAWQEITSFDVVVVDRSSYGISFSSLVQKHGKNNTKLGLINNSKKPNLYWLGQQVANVERGTTNENQIRSALEANDSARLKAIIKELGVSEKDMAKKSEEELGWNHQGYRFIAEKLIWMSDEGWFFTNSRKELAQVIPNSSSPDVTSFYNGLWELRTAGGNGVFPGDIRTTTDDINVRRGSNKAWNYNNFKNYNSGVGLGIISIGHNPYSDIYDYTIDAACTNCQDTSSNASFIIQDMNNWEAIADSKNYVGDNKNIKTYYYKNNNTYCREEIKVDFPDVSKKINVKTGMYFTVGATGEELGYSAIDRNFGDISVTRTRECQGSGASSYAKSHPFGTVTSGDTKDDNVIDKGTGIVKLKYTENTVQESQYDQDEITLIPNECEENVNGGTRTMTCKYGLPSYVYRYVKDGQSIFNISEADKTGAIDLGTPNLPISFNNYSSVRATVQLAYELPNDSQLKKSYTKNNTYLSSGKKDNIYKKYIDGTLSGSADQNEIQKSACAKLYGYNTSGFKTCAKNRTTNKIGNDESSNCIARNTLGSGATEERYICPITAGNDTTPPGDGGNDDNQCRYDSNTDTYYGKEGTPVSKTQYYKECPQSCVVVDGIYYGKIGDDGNGRVVTQEQYAEECLKYCEIVEENGQTIYYDKEGNGNTDPDVPGGYNEDCPDGDGGNGEGGNCPREKCGGNLCCPDGSCATDDGWCPFNPGTPPGNGGINIIYRPIDLINPFPGQDATIRATGSNWCAYNVKTKVIDCSADNAIVKRHINDNRSHDDYEIYGADPLYEVVLDPDTMKDVRRYNDKQEKSGGYGDYTLNCVNNSIGCYSTFLRDESIVDISGKCSRKSDLGTCAESK